MKKDDTRNVMFSEFIKVMALFVQSTDMGPASKSYCE